MGIDIEVRLKGSSINSSQLATTIAGEGFIDTPSEAVEAIQLLPSGDDYEIVISNTTYDRTILQDLIRAVIPIPDPRFSSVESCVKTKFQERKLDKVGTKSFAQQEIPWGEDGYIYSNDDEKYAAYLNQSIKEILKDCSDEQNTVLTIIAQDQASRIKNLIETNIPKQLFVHAITSPKSSSSPIVEHGGFENPNNVAAHQALSKLYKLALVNINVVRSDGNRLIPMPPTMYDPEFALKASLIGPPLAYITGYGAGVVPSMFLIMLGFERAVGFVADLAARGFFGMFMYSGTIYLTLTISYGLYRSGQDPWDIIENLKHQALWYVENCMPGQTQDSLEVQAGKYKDRHPEHANYLPEGTTCENWLNH